MKRGFLIGYIVLFFAVCAAPGLLLLLGVESPNYEKRALASPPSIWDENGFNAEFPEEFDTYFSENFGLRPLLVTANAALRRTLLSDSSSEKVIVGREGWLFFAETLDDYLGRSALADDDIARLARTLALQQESLRARGTAFVVALAPNKNTIYPEYMPARLLPESRDSNLSALQAAMDAHGVPYADLRAALAAARSECQIYHRLDTHWNNAGALVAYRTILETVSAQLPGFTWDDYAGVTGETEHGWHGDLSVMLLPSLRATDEQIEYPIPENYRAERPIRSPEDIRIETRSDANDTALLIFRDSFCNALIPFLSNAFGRTLYSRAVPYDYGLMEDTDVVVLEIVERNIPELLKYAPLLSAPRRECVNIPEVPGTRVSLGVRQAEGGLVIYGAAEGEGLVTVRLAGPADACFEPFPLLSDEDAAALPERYGNGFTMYLPSGVLPAGEYAVSVVIEKKGETVSSSALAQVTMP
ncbi:MAG: hypothetical protein GX549_04945 [Clostridiales bacterium]|nr:hypothetical protein [Clostridiales bacterium]